MKLHRITACNFLSFAGEQTFHFPDDPGLYFMQGVNEVEPRLGGNGAGKTTLWEAMFWCLYGVTSDGMKAGDICNWGASRGAWVEIAFEGDDALSLQVMRRQWSPNSWTLQDIFGNTIDLAKDSGGARLADLRLATAPFLHCVYMAQNGDMFLDLKHDAQSALFSEVMGLNRWVDLSAKASARASTQDGQTRRLEGELASIEGRLAAMGKHDPGAEAKRWQSDRAERVAALEAKYMAGVARATVLKNAWADAEARGQESLAEMGLGAEIETLEDMRREYNRAKAEASDMRYLATSAAHALERHAEALSAAEHQERCEACGQALRPDARRVAIQRARKTHDNALKADAGAQKEAKAAASRADDLLNAVLDQERRVDDGRAAMDQLEQEERAARRAYDLHERELDRLEDDAERALAEVNPYAGLEARALAEIERLSANREDCLRDLDHSRELHSLFSYWVRGFKEVRLQEIAEALGELEIEVNSCVIELGLVGWELQFSVDRESKGGNVQRGFTVRVVEPGGKAAPWGAWSGGEKQRLRLAGDMGLANLIRSRTGAEIPLEVWDEPSAGLSPQGVQDMLETLERRAIAEGRQVWVVDHTAHSFGGFSGGAVITKTAGGSMIEQHSV